MPTICNINAKRNLLDYVCKYNSMQFNTNNKCILMVNDKKKALIIDLSRDKYIAYMSS